MSRPVLLVYGLPEAPRHALLRGPIFDWLKDSHVAATWTPRLRGWTVRTDRLGDVIARAEHDGLIVRMRGPVSPR